jgi:hypothetical protein
MIKTTFERGGNSSQPDRLRLPVPGKPSVETGSGCCRTFGFCYQSYLSSKKGLRGGWKWRALVLAVRDFFPELITRQCVLGSEPRTHTCHAAVCVSIASCRWSMTHG